MFIPDCTLVTACFDLSAYHTSSRTPEKALKGIDVILKLPIYLIIFGNKPVIDIIKERRHSYGYESMTLFICQEYEEIWSAQFTQQVKDNRNNYWPTRDVRTCPESHLICANKFDFVLKGIEMNPFQTSTFGWIDSNLHVDENTNKICHQYNMQRIPYVLNHIKKDKFHIQIMGSVDKKYKNADMKREYYDQYRWLVSGCLFTCGIEVGKKILTRLKTIVKDTTLAGYGHGEEMYYLEVLDEFYDDIERSYGDYGQILNNFINITTNFFYVYSLIMTKAYEKQHYREAYDCSTKLIYSVENHLLDTNLDYGLYISTMRYQYYSATHCKPDACEAIIKKMKHIASINKSFNGALGGYFV